MTQTLLTQTQIDELNLRTNNGTANFDQGYAYIVAEIDAGRLSVDSDTELWFRITAAAEISNPRDENLSLRGDTERVWP